MKLSIVIVTWNSAKIIRECLTLIESSEIGYPYEVILIDNLSEDDTVATVEEFDVTVLKSEENLGFGRGNNAAVAHAKGDYLLFLNPDAYVKEKTAIAALVDILDREPELAAVGPRLLNLDGTHQVGDAGYAPNLCHMAAHQFFLNRIHTSIKGFQVVHPRQLRGDPFDVDWIAGTCMLMRRKDFQDVGGFSDQIFMYGEDVELCLRLRTRGRRVGYAPSCTVVHLQGATQKGDSQIYVSTKWLDSLFSHLFRKEDHSALARQALKLIMIGGFLLRSAIYGLRGFAFGRDIDKAKMRAMLLYARYVGGIAA